MLAQTTRLLELVANFGIVAGLILVAVQIRQDEDIARRDQFTELNTLANAFASRLVGENPAHAMAKVFDPDGLTSEDILILDALYKDQLGKAIRLEDEFRESGLPAYEISRWLAYVSNPFGYAWWQVNQADIARLMPSYAQAVNVELGKLAGRPDAREYDRQLVSEMKKYVASLE